ncbi:MAG: helicase [Deltaproteobacteria bacterium]|jgi:hypothetical protein|nr:helicase [Deltaproteobacteria bacterium]
MTKDHYSAEKDLKELKDFQRKTVEYVFDRLYGANPTNRFLVADEVGLGKTFVAKGVIAKSLEYMQDRVKRYDVVYICSNEAIAKQNVVKLNILGSKGFSISTRLTYLIRDVKNLTNTDNLGNFISLTPGTAFDLLSGHSSGRSDERAIIYRVLHNLPISDTNELEQIRKGLHNILQVSVEKENWDEQTIKLKQDDLDEDLSKAYQKRIIKNQQLFELLKETCDRFSRYRSENNISLENKELRNNLIGQLRTELAKTNLTALEPDLIILDEFQRFKHVLSCDDYTSIVANELFKYKNVKILLLSATPYKMYTLDGESDLEDHYADFMATLQFLFDDPNKLEEIKDLLSKYRLSLHALNNATSIDLNIKNALEKALLQVMCRTERVVSTIDRNSMLEVKERTAPLVPKDLVHAATVQKVASFFEAGDIIEYWKSMPYLLNFLKDYDLRKKIDSQLESPTDELISELSTAKEEILRKKKLDNYEEIDGANPRMRLLFKDTLDNGMWQLLWLPPSMPYMKPNGVYKDKKNLTKILVFSSWNAVPNAIATICSYEAERRMIGETQLSRKQLHSKTSQLLNFSISTDTKLPTGMSLLSWMWPSNTLATKIDPLIIALKHGKELLDIIDMKTTIKFICQKLLDKLPEGNTGRRTDDRWYWAAPFLLDAKYSTRTGRKIPTNFIQFFETISDLTESTHIKKHLDLLLEIIKGTITLGPKPKDLADRLCDLSLASPGVCALRTLKRLAKDIDPYDEDLFISATKIACGFRSFFNSPETIHMLRKSKDNLFLNLVIQYSIDGNFQAMLDEYVHNVCGHSNIHNTSAEELFELISEDIYQVLTLRTSRIQIDEIKISRDNFSIDNFNAQCHFALRFSNIKNEDSQTIARAKLVQLAFNSPFRPFVLASTSIGQEGLDFHVWCHAVMHWNLPSNPIDLEQREGRIQRFKGHAIRKNVAEKYGLSAFPTPYVGGDPWEILFDIAAQDKESGQSDLIPYWIFEEGSARVERRVPLIPYSRELDQFKRLKRSLTFYRMVFGQPRQEDLLASLSHMTKDISSILISLTPPD